MPDNILFYLVFLSQIILISFYFPGKILERVRYVVEKYPPSEYPKLYPVSLDKIEKGQRTFRNMNLLILFAGLVLVVLGFLSGYSPTESEDGIFLTFYFMVQFSPMMVAEFSGFKYFKLMRKANSPTTRKAQLQPRRLFDFVSSTLFGLAVLLYFAFVFFVLYIYQFEFHPESKAFINIITLTVCNLFFAGIIAWNMYGKKLNPHQAHKDRMQQIKLTVKSLVLISIAATLFLAIAVIFDNLDSDKLMPLAMCLYFQLLAVISFQSMTPVLQIDNTDFDVYKAEPGAKISDFVSEDGTETEKRLLLFAGIGLALGLSFGVFLGFKEGATIVGMALIGGIAGVIGMVLGIALACLLNFRKGTSSNQESLVK